LQQDSASFPVHVHCVPFPTDIQTWLYGGAISGLKGLAAGVEPVRLAAAMALAAVFGMVHAFMPGHGKTVIVSYYLGRPGHVLSGLAASSILVLTHVGSAIVLVLAGFLVLRRTLGGAGRAPAFEIASSALIIAIGLWLLYRALRPHEHVHGETDVRALAFVTGLVPCPLTTFIMVYASAQGIVVAGLLITAGMVVGMIATVAAFAIATVLLRDRLIALLKRSDRIRWRLGRGLEIASAVAIIAFGAWMMITR